MKKLNKLVAILVALAMMMALAVTSAFAAPAKQTDGKAITNGTADVPANVAIEKVLKVADGAAIPGTTFKFGVTLVATDEKDAEGNVIAKAAPAEFTGYNNEVEATVSTINGNGVTGYVLSNPKGFTAAGTYYFKVVEKVPNADDLATMFPNATERKVEGNVVTITTGKTTEIYTYDTTPHYVVVGVAAHKNPDGTTTYYSNSIAVINPETQKEELKEVQVPVPGELGDTEQKYESGYAFDANNNYRKVGDGALKIGKNVTIKEDAPEGTDFDHEKTFTFHIGINKPSTVSGEKTYNAKLYKGATDTTGTALTFEAGEVTSVELADDWYVEFTDIDYGATYTIDEDDYSAIGYAYKSGKVETAKAVSDDAQISNDETITNEYNPDDDNTKTGITMNNLPFIVLALVAIGGLVAYVVVRRRNADEA